MASSFLKGAAFFEQAGEEEEKRQERIVAKAAGKSASARAEIDSEAFCFRGWEVGFRDREGGARGGVQEGRIQVKVSHSTMQSKYYGCIVLKLQGSRWVQAQACRLSAPLCFDGDVGRRGVDARQFHQRISVVRA